MAKLKNIIKQLSEKDYKELYNYLINSNAEKSAFLLKAMRDKHLTDARIMLELEVNENAYYTLRSRLHLKIEEFLYEELAGARTEILRKVANINELLFSKRKTIAIATLKKIEKELIDYDLSNELTIVYKSLKKLHINSPDYYQYSQLYNKHVAYTLAIDKAEDLLAEYFKKYGSYFLSGIEKEKLELSLLMREMQNVSNLYKSHRLYVYTNAMLIWHRLFVEGGESMDPEAESVEDILHNVQKIFDTYHMDTIYYHLDIVFDFLRLEYYNHYKVWKQFEKHFEEVNNTTSRLMMNYTNYTFPAQLLISKLGRHIRLKTEENILEEAEFHFQEFESDPSDTPQQFILTSYQALGYYYAGQFEQAAKIMNGLLNDPNLKKYPYATVEIKTLLGLQYVILGEVEIFRQLTSSIQRQARLIGEDVCYNILQFNKILRITVSEAQKNKENKLKAIIPSINWENASFFSPVSMIRLDDKFIKLLCRY